MSEPNLNKTRIMNYSLDRLPNNRWGIYHNSQLLASIDTQEAGLKIIAKIREKRALQTGLTNYALKLLQAA